MKIADLLPISSDALLAEKYAITILLTARSRNVATTSALGAEEEMQRRMTMSIPIKPSKAEYDSAIVERVATILLHTSHPTDVKITIEGRIGELPTINYNITERIIPEDGTIVEVRRINNEE